MISPITILERQGINVNNFIQAIQDAKALGWKTPEQFRTAIFELVGDAINLSQIEDRAARFVYLYLVQNFVKQRDIGPLNIRAVIDKSLTDAANMLSRVYGGDLSYILLLEEYQDTNIDGTQNTKVRGRKGQKKNRALEIYLKNKDTLSRIQIIHLFMEELDMSKAGATTYYYNLIKELKN